MKLDILLKLIAFLFSTIVIDEWRSVDHKHWQVQAPDDGWTKKGTQLFSPTPECMNGMVGVHGKMKLGDPRKGSVEDLQRTTCVRYKGPFNDDGSPKFPERCEEFDRPKWEAIARTLPSKQIDVCIDRYEYPNVAGQYPLIYVSYYEARDMCLAQHKRLCTEDEWTFACEGPEALPYPYGYKRDDVACNIDKPWIAPNLPIGVPRDGNKLRDELARLWQGERSGARGGCVSPFGVHDMTGNVDEWTSSIRPRPYKSVMKGGYWGQVRNR